jgi:hypothetical protein
MRINIRPEDHLIVRTREVRMFRPNSYVLSGAVSCSFEGVLLVEQLVT